MYKKLQSSVAKGFTLIELLIVIAIIAILTVAFLPTLRGGTSKARDASKKALLTDISVVLENMINDAKELPKIDGCITDFTLGTGKEIAAALGRVPQSFPPVNSEKKNLCVFKGDQNIADGTYVYYKNFDQETPSKPGDYILAIEMENVDNGNVKDAKTAKNITEIQKASEVVDFTDTKPVNGNNSSFYYLIGKGS